MKVHLIEAILVLCPNAKVEFRGDAIEDLDWLDTNDSKRPSNEEILKKQMEMEFENLQKNKINEISKIYQTKSTANVSYKDVLYKGGDASAGAISGAVTLAQSLQESNVKIIASDDSANEMSFNEALKLSGLIAKEWRTAFFRYKELKLQISNAATVEELDLISWEEV